MTAVLQKMPDRFVAGAKGCAPVACNDCGIYGLCRATSSPDADLSVLDTIVKERRLLKRGDLLYRSGETGRAVYAIRSGSVKTYMMTDDGRMQITGFHIAGELLGLDALASGIHGSEAMVLETTMVCEVPIETLQAFSTETPAVNQQMVRILSQEISDNQELMLLLGKKSADERLATFLLSLSRRLQKRKYSPSRFNLSMSRSDIGNYLGIAEETVCRMFSRFQDDGLLAAERRDVHIFDLARLESIARG